MTGKKNSNKLIKVNTNGYLSLKFAVPTPGKPFTSLSIT